MFPKVIVSMEKLVVKYLLPISKGGVLLTPNGAFLAVSPKREDSESSLWHGGKVGRVNAMTLSERMQMTCSWLLLSER
jgi:hypothetical protein